MDIRIAIRRIVILLLPLLGLGPVAAQESFDFSKVPFWINVPLELYDMHPDVTGGRITCDIRGAGDVLVASGAAGFSIDTLSRSAMLTPSIPLQLVSGRAVPDGQTYACVFWLTDGERQLPVEASGPQPSPKFAVAPGKPFNVVIRGVIVSSLKSVPMNNKPIKDAGAVR